MDGIRACGVRGLILALALVAPGLEAQTAAHGVQTADPGRLAAVVMQRFVSGTPDQFAAVFPDSSVQVMVQTAARQHAKRVAGATRVLWRSGDRAVLLLAGTIGPADTTDAVARVRGGPRQFAGLYEARELHGAWSVSRALPIDSLNSIRGQAIHADLVPGKRVDIVDTVAIGVGAPYGFTARMSPAVVVRDVRVDGRRVPHSFSAAPAAGVLWIDAPMRASSMLVLSYSIPDVPRPSPRGARAPADSGPPAFGQHFNTDGWHPYLDFNSANDRASFVVTVRAPKEYRVTTSLPQTDTVVGDTRIVRGVSAHPQFLVSLLYDRYWQPKSTQVGALRVETFFRPDARIAHDTAVAAFARVFKLFNARFGLPNDPPYLAVVESFGYGATSGCGQREADLVMCGGGVTDSITHPNLDNPSYTWAHETSHAWTMNADGPAATMLREGWATYAEATALGAEYPEYEATFWERARNGVMLGTEGHQSLIPPGPTGGSYSKGGWVFHMFNYLLGDSAFDRAIRAFSRAEFEVKPAGYRELIAMMSKESGYDLTSFAMPWFSGKFMPDLDGRVAGTRLIVTQRQPESVYDLPKLDVDLVTARGIVRRVVHVTKLVDTIDVGDVGLVSGVKFDPDHHFLMQRRWGEVVRFELPAAKVPAAKSVAITAGSGQASFSLTPIEATREGDLWVVVLPLSEGRYPWHWEINGGSAGAARGAMPGPADPTLAGIREVKPLQRIGPYPR